MIMDWVFEPDPDPAFTRRLARELHIPAPFARVLTLRGMHETTAAQRFLSPKLRELHDPFLLPAMDRAVERLLDAVDHSETVVLFGDYDVDGISSVALLYHTLEAYGAPPACFLPLRMDEGYGLSTEGISRCLETHRPHLLMAVDCGTNSLVEIAALQKAGVDVIVLDHHEVKEGLPDCIVVNPKIDGAYDYLCTAGLAFKLAHAMLKARPLPEFDLREQLDLAALGTLADLVPLRDENRILARKGLARMPHTSSPGLRALLEIGGIAGVPTASDVGFRVGPRLNAAGRIGAAQEALHLLLTTDEHEARRLALGLDAQNRERQNIESRTLKEAEEQLEKTGQIQNAAIVVGQAGWHPGVVGIVASRLSRAHARPAIVVGFDDAGMGHGSGRSVEGFSLIVALGACSRWLGPYGGHAMAAGVTVEQQQFEAFRAAFHEVASAALSGRVLRPRLEVDAELSIDELDAHGLMAAHDRLGPFGMGNPQPVFLARNVMPGAEPRWLKERHLGLTFRHARGRRRGIYFSAPKESLPEPPWDVAFRIERDTFNGADGVAVHVQGLRAAAG